MSLPHNRINKDSVNILDLKLTGSQIILHSRPNSRPPSRIAVRERPMSATPTLFFQDKHSKTPTWMRPQSADHFATNSQRKKLAAKFHEPSNEKGKTLSRNGVRHLGDTYNVGSMTNLLESTSLDDFLDSESSVGPSPVPNDPSSTKLEPGLKSKPPIPPPVTNKCDQKSLDDIINIKFQRWFPESVHQPDISYSSDKCLNDKLEIKSNLDRSTLERKDYHSATGDEAFFLQSDKPSKFPSDASIADSLDSGTQKFGKINKTIVGCGSNFFSERKVITEEKKPSLSNKCLSPIDDISTDPLSSKTNARGAECLADSSLANNERDNQTKMYQNSDEVTNNDSAVSNIESKNFNSYDRFKQPSKCEFNNHGAELSCNRYTDFDLIKPSNPTPNEKGYEKEQHLGLKTEEKKGKKVTIVDSNDAQLQTDFNTNITSIIKCSDTKYKHISSDNNEMTPIKHQNGEVIDTFLFNENITQCKDPDYLSGIENDRDVTRINPNSINIKEKPEVDLKNESVISWVADHNSGVNIAQNKELGPGSTYNEILNILKVIEKDEVESLKSTSRSISNNLSSAIETPVGARDILTFLDGTDDITEVSNEPVHTELPMKIIKPVSSSHTSNGRMATLLSYDSSDLAKHVMTLSLELEERNLAYEKLKQNFEEAQQKANKQKKDSEVIIKRHQKFIDQLLSEKRVLGEQCATVIKDMETKHANTLRILEERHAIELKKQHDKMLAAEKIRREKWVDSKTKKIKELTVKGLEPELQRMTNIHQEELADLRRAHERELSEIESACQRRISAAREQGLRDRESAVMEEREAARKKLELEMSELERSYQDQRRRLLAEVRDEKERVERESEANLAERNRHLEDKWQKAHKELDNKLIAMEEKYKGELKNMRETLEGERQSWLSHQVTALAEKERAIREQCKKERDRHIDMVLQKLEAEATEKEKAAEKKFLKMKEQYEMEIKELETAENEIKRKLKDARTDNQSCEDIISQLKIQISQLQGELSTVKQTCNRLQRDYEEVKNAAKTETTSQLDALQRELQDTKAKQEECLAKLTAEKQQELQQVYNRHTECLTKVKKEKQQELQQIHDRVIEAISRKDETIRNLQKQRDAALEQCTKLENLLQHQRKEFTQKK